MGTPKHPESAKGRTSNPVPGIVAVTAAFVAELAALRELVAQAGSRIEHRVVCEVEGLDEPLPIHVLALGARDPAAPAVGFFAGVHGLERIGVHVIMSHLRSLIERLQWDETLQGQLEAVRLVFMPLVNPGGLERGTRANPRGVDLMRNAPVDAPEAALWLVGGHRISPRLPWYRGAAGAAMEAESEALCTVVAEELLSRPFSIALDCHSGFGAVDRIWFPYAHTARPMPSLPDIHALAQTFERSHPHHRYVIEPQSRQYLAHGDLWDHLALLAAARSDHVFLPLTLELGSWTWVRKNPRQLFSRQGIFNPVIEHRLHRALRRHVAWLDFLGRAAISHRRWLRLEERERHRAEALERWYTNMSS